MNWFAALIILGILLVSVVLYAGFNLVCLILDNILVLALNREFDKEMKKSKMWSRTPKYKRLIHIRKNIPYIATAVWFLLIIIGSLFIPIPT